LITYGFSKDHRPDLKQLLFILTTSADGGVPVQFRCANGNTNAFTYGRYGSRNGRGTYDC
jgi:transposase